MGIDRVRTPVGKALLVGFLQHDAWDSENPSITHVLVFVCDSFMDIQKRKEENLIISQRNAYSFGIRME